MTQWDEAELHFRKAQYLLFTSCFQEIKKSQDLVFICSSDYPREIHPDCSHSAIFNR